MCFENIPCKATYSVKNKGFERLPNNVGFVTNLSINAKKLSYLYFWDSLCVRKIVPACTSRFLCTHSEGFQKEIYFLIKSYIFYFSISQVNLTSN